MLIHYLRLKQSGTQRAGWLKFMVLLNMNLNKFVEWSEAETRCNQTYVFTGFYRARVKLHLNHLYEIGITNAEIMKFTTRPTILAKFIRQC